MSNKAERIMATIFFILAGVVLLMWGRGPLVWPGVAVSVLGVVGCLTGRTTLAAAVGSLAAGVSLFAQSRWGVCPDCLLAACLLGMASIAAILKDVPQKPWAVMLTIPLLIGGICLGLAIQGQPQAPAVSQEPSKPTVADSYRAAQPDTEKQAEQALAEIGTTKKAITSSKIRLYFSPWCRHCDAAVHGMVALDPEGRTWRPVVVPCSAFDEGKAELARAGYKGEAECAGESPEHAVPCLVTDTQTLVGDGRIQEWITKRKAGSAS